MGEHGDSTFRQGLCQMKFADKTAGQGFFREFFRHTGDTQPDPRQGDEQFIAGQFDLRREAHAFLQETVLQETAGTGFPLQQDQRQIADLTQGIGMVKIHRIFRRRHKDGMGLETQIVVEGIIWLISGGEGQVTGTVAQKTHDTAGSAVQDLHLDAGVGLVVFLQVFQ